MTTRITPAPVRPAPIDPPMPGSLKREVEQHGGVKVEPTQRSTGGEVTTGRLRPQPKTGD